MKRRGLLWALAGSAAAALAYAAGIEPYQLHVNAIEITAPRLPAEFDGYQIYIVSDLHMRQMGRRERRLKAALTRLPPADLVAVTGDLIHTPQGERPFFELAQAFRSRDGVFAVFGNSEHKNGVRPHAFAQSLQANNITPLLNCHRTIQRGSASLALVGVDDPVNEKDRIADALAGVPEERFSLLLMHSPDTIAEAVVRGVDLALSGHTHGGQVRLPFLGAPYTHSLLGRRMSSGYYAGRRLRCAIGIRPGRTQLYVTRGIGVSGLALRFLCPPELTLLTLRQGLPSVKSVKKNAVT